jgi:hypothetical protein
MKKSANRTMTGSAIRALCVAGVFAVSASAATPGIAASNTLDLNSYTTAVDHSDASRARLSGQFDLGLPVQLPSLSYGPRQVAQIANFGATGSLPLFDDVSLNFGTGADLAGKFNLFDAAGSDAYDGLFFSASAVNSPYATTANGGNFVALNLAPASDLHLTLGAASLAAGTASDWTSPSLTVAQAGGWTAPFDNRSANSLLAGVSWNFAPWAGIGLTASQTSEQNGVLGNFDPTVRLADTSALGVSARVQLGNGWMTTASFAEAITKLDLKPGFGSAPADDLHTRSYGIAVAKSGLFGNDAMGLAVSRPAPGSSGNSEFALISGLNAHPQFLEGSQMFDGHAPETDFELGYVTTFMDGAVALQTNASYQMNFAGQSGTNAVSLLSRAKIKF